ncbi:BTB/POZ and MATH domain-containing protein 2-like [Oryza glaberrima]|uniref:BTB/POZ and MATH domain-containing protein 2-like n=1 Tax=Oryza glaberrima TaxID=4538 RepID=UPI00224BF645|nr:BTB/POZ and MATH domain-containing protein 2-like [Oryza glaberrima]
MASSRPISESTITRSTCATRTARATHQFEIVGYSLKRCLAAGEFVRSSAFAACGYRWSVRVYSVKHKKCKGKRGTRAFMRRRDLESSAFVRDDRLIVEHLGELLERADGVGADVTFDVRGQPFAAHRIVLAMRSPVFMASLYGSMREHRAPRIAVDDMEPEVFDALLRFVYSDTLALPGDLGEGEYKEMVRQLLEAADRYAMDRLRVICELILSRSLDAKTVAATLAMADQHSTTATRSRMFVFSSWPLGWMTTIND